jgi:hypothetical protein
VRDYEGYRRQGALAFREGLPRDANPFRSDTYAHEAFDTGWWLACTWAAEDKEREAPVTLKRPKEPA